MPSAEREFSKQLKLKPTELEHFELLPKLSSLNDPWANWPGGLSKGRGYFRTSFQSLLIRTLPKRTLPKRTSLSG